jgi:hypothetical protein
MATATSSSLEKKEKFPKGIFCAMNKKNLTLCE